MLRAVGSVPPRVVPPRVTEALREAVTAVAKALLLFPERGMFIGGIAVIAHGVLRTTEWLTTFLSLHIVQTAIGFREHPVVSYERRMK